MRLIGREDAERAEAQRLSPDAAFAARSRGRARTEEPDALRTCYQCDRDRILHCKSFRRLAHKTQAFLAPEGDHYRTRLIHTLEVEQVARSIARPLGLNEDLVEAIALAHDLGHTPFGHAGERALSRVIGMRRGLTSEEALCKMMFRHAEQSARILEWLERDGQGLNLSWEVLDGVRNHSGSNRAATLEGRLVGLSDRIAYVCHDIDDAKRAGMLTEHDLPAEFCEVLGHTSSERIETMVQDVVSNSVEVADIRMSDEVWRAMMGLRSFLFSHVYMVSDAAHEEPKAHAMIADLFEHYVAHPDEVPSEYRQHDDPIEVQVADFVAGMTDRYAIRVFESLRVPRSWRVVG